MTTAKLVSLALLLTACAPAPALPTWDAALVFDGVKLGSPIGALLARAPYDTPCDVDPIDKKTATLFFWAGGPCREAPAFPAATTLVIVTPRATDAARGEQPVTLVAWAGGTYFDDRTSLPVRIGDTAEHARRLLGAPTATKQSDDSSTFSWGSVHALVIADKIAALAMGDLDIKAGGELYVKRAGVR